MTEFIKAETAEAWVARACGDTTNRHEFTPYVHVQDGVMYATDRYRCHWIETVFPDGSYDPISFMPVKLEYVPDLSKLREPFGITKTTYRSKLNIAYEGHERVEYYQIPNGPAINVQYLNEAINDCAVDILLYETKARARIAGQSQFGGWVIQELIH